MSYTFISTLTKCSPDDLPVLAGGAWWRYGSPADLRAALGVHPCCRLLGVRRARQAHIRKLRAEVAMMTLVHDERILWY